MLVEVYKKERKIICYIKQNANGFIVCTGKPSDASCLSWQYNNIQEAQKTAKEYFNNFTQN